MNILSVISASRRRVVYDPDAANYIDAVETADVAFLEPAVKSAYDAFIRGCKEDGIWSPIKACCIMAGARSLAGALAPLVGPAPTNNGFISGDYLRKTGLIGNGTSKYLNTNRNNNADPQNSCHNYVRVTGAQSAVTGRLFIGSSTVPNSGANSIQTGNITAATLAVTCRNSSTNASVSQSGTTGGKGISRASSSGFGFFTGGSVSGATRASQTPENANICVFGLPSGSCSNARIAVYSIGESLDLALLDARVTTLLSALNTAIP